jgi:hypothetical protein
MVAAPVLAAAAAVWGALGWNASTTPQADPVDLVTLVPAGDHSGGDRRAVALRGGSERPLLLTGDFFSADAPSPSFDGRWFLFAGRREASSPPAIFRMALDGSSVRLITHGSGDPGEPIALPGGGIVFTDRVDGPEGGRALFACAADGSGTTRLTFGPHRDAAPVLLEDGRLRFDRFVRTPGGGESRITMTVRPDGTGLARHLGAEPALAAPARAAERGVSDAVPAAARSAGEWREIAAVQAVARPEPPALTSVVSAARTTGTLLCLDVYASRLPAVAGLPRGSVASVQVTRAGGGAEEAVIAQAPVQPDGSFLVEVPADTLVGLSLRGRHGERLASFHSGVWVRPNENRGCVGCHEPSDRAPANRRPMALDAALSSNPSSAGQVNE